MKFHGLFNVGNKVKNYFFEFLSFVQLIVPDNGVTKNIDLSSQ